MACTAPLTAFRSAVVGDNGKRGITFNRKEAASDFAAFSVGCGVCPACRLERSRVWAMRCLHESMQYDENCFLTLTYAQENLPADGSLVKRDLSDFMKRLHNRLLRSRNYGIRYYGCGEYGDENDRPHYHAIVFNYDFNDKRYFKSNSRGEKIFTSDELSSLWPSGFATVGAVTFDSAAYVARYVMKKVLGTSDEAEKLRAEKYGSRLPEFTNMSRRPGIGMEYFKKYGLAAYEHDFIIVNGKKVRPPRFYDDKLKVVDPDLYDVVRRKRQRKAVKKVWSDREKFHDERGFSRNNAKSVVLTAKLGLSKRNV